MNRISSFFCAVSIVLALFGTTAFAQKYQGGLVDNTAVLIGNDVIMLSQIESEVQMMRARGVVPDRNARCEILEGMLVAKLFYTQAVLDSIVVNDAAVSQSMDGRMNELYASLGNDEAIEKYFGKPVYKLQQDWKAILEEQYLIQEMQRKVAGNIPALTPYDVEEYYKNAAEEDLPIISTKYRIRQIVCYPDREAAKLAAKETLVGLRERVLKGEKFSTLARIYSQDPGSTRKGGELGMTSRSVFWPEFSDAAMSLKVGQVSQVVETPDGFHIIQLIERDGDKFNARHILIKPSYTSEDKKRAFAKLDSLRNKIVSDSLDFKYAAKYYSEEKKTSTSGGLLADENTGSSYFDKDQLKPADYAVLKDMQVGDVSMPFESLDNEGRNGNTIYKIIYLEKIIPSHVATFKEDFNSLIDDVNQKNSMKAIDEFIKEKQKSTYIVIDPMFRGCNFEREGWIK